MRLNSFINAAVKSVKVDNHFGQHDMFTLANAMHNLGPKHVQFLTVPVANANYRTFDGQSAVLWDETKAKLQEPIEVGLFTARPGLGAFSNRNVVVMGRQEIHDGTQKIVIRSKAKPTYAGVDPYNFYIDRNSDDNVKDVTAS